MEIIIKQIIQELEGIEIEWNGHALAEKLGRNVVKEAHYKGTATGVRIAINVINERLQTGTDNPFITSTAKPDNKSLI